MKRRKDGRWERVKTINGDRFHFYAPENMTEKQAAKEIERQMLEFTQKQDRGKKFKDVAEMWEEHHYKHIEHQTAVRYHTLCKHAIDEFGSMYIKAIEPKDIERYLERLAGENYSKKTITDQFSVIRLIFRFAYIEKYCDKNPALYITLPKKGKTKQIREALTEDEVRIVEESVNCTFGLFAYFLLYTGCRKGEALALQWKDIDFENKTITINKSVYYEFNHPKIKLPKTSAGQRQVMLLDCLAEKLKPGKPDDYIFSGTKYGGIIPRSQFSRHWAKWQEESGLTVTAHQMRHTYNTMLFEADIDVKDAQVIMGHADISTTRNVYTHVRERRLKDTFDKMNKYVNGR